MQELYSFPFNQVHSDKVTAILIVEHCFITASADAKIKLWKKDKADRLDLLQVSNLILVFMILCRFVDHVSTYHDL